MGEAIVGAIIDILLGVGCLVIGIMNMKGNISMLHSYHTNNITEENKIAFGRLVGTGMIIVASSLIISGGLFIPAEMTKQKIYITVSNIKLFVGIGLGLLICLCAIKKYNKNIFG